MRRKENANGCKRRNTTLHRVVQDGGNVSTLQQTVGIVVPQHASRKRPRTEDTKYHQQKHH